MEKSIKLQNRECIYILSRKAVKNINLHIKPDGKIYISAPKRVPVDYIEDLLHEKSGFILNSLDKIEAQRSEGHVHSYEAGEAFPFLGRSYYLTLVEDDEEQCYMSLDKLVVWTKDVYDTEAIKKHIDELYRIKSVEIISESVNYIYKHFEAMGYAYPTIKYRYMKSKWGSCCPAKHSITFNVALVYAPEICIDYVVAHEFTHFIHPDHSKAFYSELEKIIPDWRYCKGVLNRYAQELRR